MGKGVLTAVKNVNEVLGPAVIGMDPADQRAVDTKMIEIDGTKNKSNMGANGEFGKFIERIHALYYLCQRAITRISQHYCLHYFIINTWPHFSAVRSKLYILFNNLIQKQPSSESH